LSSTPLPRAVPSRRARARAGFSVHPDPTSRDVRICARRHDFPRAKIVEIQTADPRRGPLLPLLARGGGSPTFAAAAGAQQQQQQQPPPPWDDDDDTGGGGDRPPPRRRDAWISFAGERGAEVRRSVLRGRSARLRGALRSSPAGGSAPRASLLLK
jgi:hypothetical protein